ncbi:hypothetical protein ACTXT7_004283 [Hymenolepis weldensis]
MLKFCRVLNLMKFPENKTFKTPTLKHANAENLVDLSTEVAVLTTMSLDDNNYVLHKIGVLEPSWGLNYIDFKAVTTTLIAFDSQLSHQEELSSMSQ